MDHLVTPRWGRGLCSSFWESRFHGYLLLGGWIIWVVLPTGGKDGSFSYSPVGERVMFFLLGKYVSWLLATGGRVDQLVTPHCGRGLYLPAG